MRPKITNIELAMDSWIAVMMPMRKLSDQKAGHMHVLRKVLRSWDISFKNRMDGNPSPTIFL
jgi:hypothetical protein